MKIVLIIISFIIIIFLISRFNRRNRVAGGKGYQRTSPAEVKKRLDTGEKVFLVDVRTPNEYAEKHIPKSLLLPLERLEQEAPKKLPDKDAQIFVYCLTGRRSASGVRTLVNLGYSNVYDMGGMMNWPGKMETGSRSGA
jgi:phage shock protein E